MSQALILHRDGKIQPDNRYEPVAKSLRTPEDIPPMKGMLASRKESCIHCHDVKVAELLHARDLGTLRKDMVFTYPSPINLGIEIDPLVQFRIRDVKAASPAATAGVRTGDLIRTMDDQRVLTLADMSRVLELTPAAGTLKLGLERDKNDVAVALNLPSGWRNSTDPSWRQSTGVVGPNAGLWGVAANQTQRQQLGVNDGDLAIRVTYIHKPWSREAGLKLNDYILSIDGQKTDMTIRQLQAYLHLNKDWGDTIALVVRRGDKDLKMTMTFPDKPPS
jgi:S1-C subfamily serine protease